MEDALCVNPPAHAVSPDLYLFFVVWIRTAQHELRQFFPCLCRSVPTEFPMGADNEILRRQLVFILSEPVADNAFHVISFVGPFGRFFTDDQPEAGVPQSVAV